MSTFKTYKLIILLENASWKVVNFNNCLRESLYYEWASIGEWPSIYWIASHNKAILNVKNKIDSEVCVLDCYHPHRETVAIF